MRPLAGCHLLLVAMNLMNLMNFARVSGCTLVGDRLLLLNSRNHIYIAKTDVRPGPTG